MPQLVDGAISKVHVTILKKVKTSGVWRLYPVLLAKNGRLTNKVSIRGTIEIHNEGNYYIEWREAGHRYRKAIAEPNQVVKQARLKKLELEAVRSGLHLQTPGSSEALKPSAALSSFNDARPAVSFCDSTKEAAELLLHGIQS